MNSGMGLEILITLQACSAKLVFNVYRFDALKTNGIDFLL